MQSRVPLGPGWFHVVALVLFKFFFDGFLFTYFFHSAPEEGLYCKPKYRAILFKIIWSFILVTSAAGISVPSIVCLPLSLPDPARRPPAFSIVHTDREPGTG